MKNVELVVGWVNHYLCIFTISMGSIKTMRSRIYNFFVLIVIVKQVTMQEDLLGILDGRLMVVTIGFDPIDVGSTPARPVGGV